MSGTFLGFGLPGIFELLILGSLVILPLIVVVGVVMILQKRPAETVDEPNAEGDEIASDEGPADEISSDEGLADEAEANE